VAIYSVVLCATWLSAAHVRTRMRVVLPFMHQPSWLLGV